MNLCPKCNGALDRMGCPRCDEPGARLERLRTAQVQARRQMLAGRKPPQKSKLGAPGGWFIDQCKRAAQAQHQLPPRDRAT